jgi:hypothetical protein
VKIENMNKANLILAGVVVAGLLIGVAIGGYKDASTPAASA